MSAPAVGGHRAFALVTGGGTGGHVYPALAVADELVRRGHPRAALRFVGSRRGLEARAVPAAGYAVDLLPGRGLQRRATPRALWDDLVACAAAALAGFRALALVVRWRPRVVVGVGGYASLPCVVAARLLRVPVVVHEQNAAPGLANRVAVALGARAATSLPGTPLRGAVLTGNPIRAEIAAVQREPDPHHPVVAIFGGSLGARRVNDAALGLYDRWRERDDRSVRHIAGRRDHHRCAELLGELRRAGDRLRYTLVEYEDDMPALYTQATVAVCRAGAVTVAELAAAGLPALLVPLPGAPGDHQTRNAETLAAGGAAAVLDDGELDGVLLAAELDTLLADPTRLATMAGAAHRLARPDAAARVADLVEEAAGGG